MDCRHRSDSFKCTENGSNNLDATDLEPSTSQKLRGDLIGNTTFSQSFIIRTLLQFNEPDFDFTEEDEENLCALWDMTTEEDVCMFLLNLNFDSIVCEDLLEKYRCNNRLTEILLGMLGNFLIPKNIPIVSPNQLDIALSFINSDDTGVLIQFMRFMKTLVFKTGNYWFVNLELFQKLLFILNNSLDCNLLENTFSVLIKLLEDQKLTVHILTTDMVRSCWSALNTVSEKEKDADGEFVKSAIFRRHANYFLEVIVNMGAYFSARDLSNESSNLLLRQVEDHELQITNLITTLMDFYKEEFVFGDEFIFLMDATEFIFATFLFNCDYILRHFLIYCADLDEEVLKLVLAPFNYCFEALTVEAIQNAISTLNAKQVYISLMEIKRVSNLHETKINAVLDYLRGGLRLIGNS